MSMRMCTRKCKILLKNSIQKAQENRKSPMNLLFDVETTGLPLRKSGKYNYRHPEDFVSARIVSIAWKLAHPGQVDDSILPKVHLIRPNGYSISPEVAKIHGITQEKALADGVELAEALQEFFADVGQAQRLISHNVDFDKAILKSELFRMALANPVAKIYLAHLKRLEKVCTMRLATDHFRLAKWPKLAELYTFLTKKPVEAERLHDAVYDVILCEVSYNILWRDVCRLQLIQ